MIGLFGGVAQTLGAQSLQYRSPEGVEYRADKDTGAIARAQAALAAAPRDVEKIIALSVAQAGVRQFREAIETLTRGLAIAPENVMLLRWRGHRYLTVREYDKGYADLVRGYAIDSANYGILYHLGVVRMIRGEFDAAADAFARAQRVPPSANEMAGSTDWRWMALARAGRRREGDAMLATRPDSVPTTPGYAYARRLAMYRGVTRPESLIVASDTADVQASTLHYGLGNWYLVQGDTARAREHFKAAVKSGGWPAFGFQLAEVELRRLK
ncbi:MAG: tetratricopeptide repeat protein [Gemmatimonadaceae bacterium]|nr:tetratricopeptide repeat protein [Gemmatimonadaceae bacterium]